MFAAVILAAGRSSRMGRPKALLPHRDEHTTFIKHLIAQAQLAGIHTVLVVGRVEDEDVRSEVASAGGVFVANPDPNRGQLSSLLAGLDALGDVVELDAVLVQPVDVPLISADVMRKVVERSAATDALIVRAVHRGVHGHPVVFKQRLFAELRGADPTVGAKAVVRSDPRRVLDVEVEEPGVIADVDTPDDYERLFGRTLRPLR